MTAAVQAATSQAVQKIGIPTTALESAKTEPAKLEIGNDPRALMTMHFKNQDPLSN